MKLLCALFILLSATVLPAADKAAALKTLESQGLTNPDLRETLFYTEYQADWEKASVAFKKAKDSKDFMTLSHEALNRLKGTNGWLPYPAKAREFFKNNKAKLEKLQKEGNEEAAYIIAAANLQGGFGKIDYDAAGSLALSLAKKGHMRAAVIYMRVVDSRKSKKHKSFKLFQLLGKKAHAAGILEGSAVMAKYHFTQSSNVKHGKPYLDAAIKGKHYKGYEVSAWQLNRARRPDWRLKILQEGAALGYKNAAWQLSEAYEDGDGTAKNPQMAATWLVVAAESGSIPACRKLSQNFSWSRNGQFPRNQEESAYWAAMATKFSGESDNKDDPFSRF